MKAKKTNVTWSDVKAGLKGLEQSELIELLKGLYSFRAENKLFIESRLSLRCDGLNPYLESIERWVAPGFLNRDTVVSVAAAKKAISDFRKTSGDLQGIAELQVFFCEKAAAFADDTGGWGEDYLDSLSSMFAESLKTIGKLKKADQEPFHLRLIDVCLISDNFGYGIHDEMLGALEDHGVDW